MTDTSGGPPVVAVFNHKGGVAKTTTACNLAVCLAAFGLRVVLVDLDAQGNATGSFGILPLPPVGARDVLEGTAPLEQALVATPYPRLMLLPATAALRTAEWELAERGHGQLRDRLAAQGLGRFAEVVVIDCPPSLGTVTGNALAAAAAVLIPARPDPFTHEGLVNTWYEIKRMRESANRGLSVAGVLLTMTGDDQSSADVARTMRAEFGDQVYGVEIATDHKVAEAAQLALPVTVLDPDGLAGHAYVEATAELLARLKRQNRPETILPETESTTAALNTLREWRAGQQALRRLPGPRKGWTAVPRANAPDLPADGQPTQASRRPAAGWLAAAFAAGLAVGAAALALLG